MTRFAWLLAVLLPLLVACPNVDTGTDGGDNEIVAGPEGGIFIRNGYAVDIPRGALSEETHIFVSIEDTNIPVVPMRTRISYGYRFSPKSLRFASPIKIFLPWIEDRVPIAVDPGTFDMRRNLDSEAYAQLPGTKTTLEPFQAVEAQTDRLGLFWLTSPTDPNVDRLELTPEEVTLRVGETAQFSARVVSPTGETIDAPVTWAVVPPRVASIDANGLLTAKDPGTASITARAGMQFAQAKAFVVGSTVGPSTYIHQNPFPTGNDLHGGALAPGGLGTIFAGANGTVLARDAMDRWTRLFSTPGVTLKAVGGTTPDNAVAVGATGSGSGVLLEFKGASAAPALKVFPPTQISDLSALWFDGTHGMGAGSGNELVIYRAGRWETEYHPSFEALLSVIGDGTGRFVVVGDLGSIYQWDPGRRVWDSLYDRRLAVKLEAGALVDFASAEAWAVGGDKLWHFEGNAWVAESLPPVRFEEVTAVGAFDDRVVVAGKLKLQSDAGLPPSLGEVLVRSAIDPGDGGAPTPQWAAFSLRDRQVPRGVFGGGPASPTGYVVGDFGAVWEWSSATKSFTEVSKGFYGDVADLAVVQGDVFAAVNECSTLRCQSRTGQLMHPGPSGLWEPVGTFPASGQPILSVAAKSPSEVLITTAGGVWRWDGSTWTGVPISGGGDAIFDLKFCGDSVWGAGAGGIVYTGTSSLLRVFLPLAPDDLTAVHCPSPTEVWVAGNGFLAGRLGATGSFVSRTSEDITQGPWQAVWSPGGGEAYAFGDAYYGVYWDTALLNLIEATGPVRIDVATGMWGSSVDNLYLVGLASLPTPFGFALRFDGAQWSLVDSGAQRTATCIDGRSKDEIWIGTQGGGVLRAVPPP
ncbi:MAG: Ig-like domain-containing protein [Myxococcota bacterium]